MKEIYANNRLQNTKLFKEYKELRDYYYKLSLEKEHKQQSFFKNKQFVKSSTGEFITPSYSFENHYKMYSKSIEAKVYCIEQLSNNRGLLPIFLTFTNDERFYPFQSISYNNERLYTSLNKSFIFDDLESSIKYGYEHLQYIYRVFYKRVKKSVNELLYIKVFEMSKVLVPHLHCLFFVKKSDIKIVKAKFEKIKEEFNLKQVDFTLIDDEIKETEPSRSKTGIKRASKYIMKYITKAMSEDAFSIRLYDGWKRKNKIRQVTTSNLDLSLEDYRNIYHNLDSDTKTSILQKAKTEGINIFYFILKNLYRVKIIKKGTQTIIKQFGDIKRATISYFKTVSPTRTGGYRIDSLTFIIGDYTYTKEKYLIMEDLRWILNLYY